MQQHERVTVLSGDRHPNKFRIDRYLETTVGSPLDRYRCDLYLFNGSTTIGVPDLMASSRVVYYEVEMKGRAPMLLMPKQQFGFSLVDGMDVTDGHSEIGVGDNIKSWGFDGLTGYKIHVMQFGDDRLRAKWGPDSVIGIAANLDKGMIAVSVDGDWRYANGNGVKFEDESIKSGVYPCISGNVCALECRFGPDFKHSPPPISLWNTWPKYEDTTWLGLTEEARQAAIVLGYTQRSWMSSDSNPIERKRWEELTNEEQAAANILGYDADIWAQLTTLWAEDGSDGDSSDDEDDTSRSSFSSMNWNELPGDARRAAETLGFNPAWEELTLEQQRGAIVIGCDEESWDNDSDGDSSGSDSTNSDGFPFDHLSWIDSRSMPVKLP